MVTLGTPLSPHATRVLLLGSGELGKEVAIELQRLGVEVIAADRYAPLLEDLASRGYVVVAPEFPLATTIYGGPASQADLDNEPGDVSFVLTKVLEASAAAGPLQGLLDPARVAVMG